MRRRGFLYLAQLPGLAEKKTVLVVSSDVVNEFLQPIVVRVTTTHRLRSLPTFVPLRAAEGGLRENSYAICHEIVTLEDEVIEEEPLGPMLPPARLHEVEVALGRALDLAA